MPTTNWIMGCVTSTVYAILINGEATNFIQSRRGLRQGFPLSPFLFILVMEGLSLMLKKGQADGVLTGIKVSRIIKVLHLLFVDDVIIMSKATISEWIEISNILSVFCRASGLRINVQKSTFLHTGVQQETLDELNVLFNFDFKDLSEGFKYLGYFLKPDSYKAEDWRWLIEKFDFRINHWCNRLLTLGGRYVLVKAILESLPVYWLALAHIPLFCSKKDPTDGFFLPVVRQQEKNEAIICVTGRLSRGLNFMEDGGLETSLFSTGHWHLILYGEY
jgi:hypothetical protein